LGTTPVTIVLIPTKFGTGIVHLGPKFLLILVMVQLEADKEEKQT